MISSTASFSAGELAYMHRMCLTYMLMVRMALLKYFLYYLQIDHVVPALVFLRRWMDAMARADRRFPLGLRVYREIIEPAASGRDWPQVTWGEEVAFLFDHLAAVFSRRSHGLPARHWISRCQQRSARPCSPRSRR